MKLKLGLPITIRNKPYLHEYLPSGRIEIEGGAHDGDVILMENGEFLLWEGYSIGDNLNLLTESSAKLVQENEDLVLWEGSRYAIYDRLITEDHFNILQETGDYINYSGLAPVRIELCLETDFNLLQENDYPLLVDRYK